MLHFLRFNKLSIFLCKFSGEDFAIVQRCPWKIRNYFAFIGLFVLVMFVGCFYSCASFIYNLFGHYLAFAIPVGLLWGGIVVNIYLLLLYTLSPTLLPGKESPSPITFALIYRVVFLVILAVVISKPVEVSLFSGLVKSDLEEYKQEKRNSFFVTLKRSDLDKEAEIVKRYITDLNTHAALEDEPFRRATTRLVISVFTDDILFLERIGKLKHNRDICIQKDELVEQQRINAELAVLKLKSLNGAPTHLRQGWDRCRNSFIFLLQQENLQVRKMEKLLEESNLYIRRIELLSSALPISWLFTLLTISVFLIPVYLKFVIRKKGVFYPQKAKIERSIVEDEYTLFKEQYRNVFYERFETYKDFYESHIDPPFNTQKKSDPATFKSQEDFLSIVYGVD